MAMFVSEVGGRLLAVLAIALFASALGGCKPLPPCPASDTSCWPCTNPGNTNPSCTPFPSDATKKPKEIK